MILERLRCLSGKWIRRDSLLWKVMAALYPMLRHLFRKRLAREKISRYMDSRVQGDEVRVIVGGHWHDDTDWLMLSETEQDITRPLNFGDASIDVLFTEHVIEHVDLAGALQFLKEANRVLKHGGVLRIVCPTIERLIGAPLDDDNGRTYIENSLIAPWSREHTLLRELKLSGIFEAPKTFQLNALFTRYGHRFIWSSDLLVRVLRAIGFRQARIMPIGEGIRPEYCIERRRRGLYLGHDRDVDRSVETVFDAESEAIEAVK